MARSGLVFLGCLLVPVLSTGACTLDWDKVDKTGGKDAEAPPTDGGERLTNREGGVDGAIDGAAPAEGGPEDGNVGSTPDASDQRTIEEGGSIPETDVTSGQIARVRTAIRSTDTWGPLSIDGAIVTYVKKGFGDQPVGSADGPGLYVQNDDSGPALFIAMDPTTIVAGGARVGDRLNLVVGAGEAPGDLVLVTSATARLVGEGVPLPQAQSISELDLLSGTGLAGIAPGEHELESELVSCTATIASPFITSGAGFSAAQITTVGEPSPAATFVLRAPDDWVAARRLFVGCTVSISDVPLVRYQSKLQLSAWEQKDAEVTCPPFAVVSTYPTPSNDVPLATSIKVTFNQAVEATDVTTQVTSGPCTGSIQLSLDNFASCLPFRSANASMDLTSTAATMVPKDSLAPGSSYYLRVVSGLKAANGAPLSLSHTIGFTTTTETASCNTPVVISQVYGGGGNSLATLSHDFIELHNRGAAPVSISGWSLQHQTGAGWTVHPLPDVAIAGGGYYLIKGGAGGSSGAPLEGVDSESTLALGARTGRLALVANTTPTGSGDDPLRRDVVAYGFQSVVSPAEGASTAELSSSTAALRSGSGCVDTNDNASDFTVGTPAPRSAAGPRLVCACSAVP